MKIQTFIYGKKDRGKLPIYSFGGDLRFSAFTSKLLAVDFSSSVLFVSIMSPSSVEMTCCCLRGFFLGEAPGGKSLGGIERLLASNARDGDTVLVVKGGTAERKGEEENPNHQQGKDNTLALFAHCVQAQLLFQNTVSSMDTPLHVCLSSMCVKA